MSRSDQLKSASRLDRTIRHTDPPVVEVAVTCRRSGRGGVDRAAAERFSYAYNFFADWRVELRVEQIRPPEPGKTYPLCTGGRRAGPPEDWDGPWAFLERTEPYLVFDATLRAWEIIGELLDSDERGDLASVGLHRHELSGLAPLLGLERFDRRACNKVLAGGATSAPERSRL